MTIIVFLIDTSASMNQRAFMGGRPTLLDVAKGAVEMFVKVSYKCWFKPQDIFYQMRRLVGLPVIKAFFLPENRKGAVKFTGVEHLGT